MPFNPSYNLIGNKWVFQIKRKADGFVNKLKAWLVAKGFYQTHDLGFTETFSLIVKSTIIKVLLTSALHFEWDV